ncbi:BH3-interacting domain death agonist, partial [Ophiophagus hannah]
AAESQPRLSDPPTGAQPPKGKGGAELCRFKRLRPADSEEVKSSPAAANPQLGEEEEAGAAPLRTTNLLPCAIDDIRLLQIKDYPGDHYDSIEVAGIVLYSFLENSSDITFASTLCSLKQQLLAPKQPSVYDDGELQTDGNNFGRVEDRVLGARLAVIGDKLAAEIEHPFVHNLAQQFMVENVSSQVITQHLSEAVRNVVARMPPEMEQEKAMLVAAMILAKKVANVVPALLQQVFNTTVNYINQNLHDYSALMHEPETIVVTRD